MLKKLFGVIDNARLALSSETALIRQGISGLDLIDKKLTARAVDFIASGNDPQVLVDLRAKGSGAGVPLGRPGRLKWMIMSHSNEDGATRAVAKSSLAGRSTLYQRVGNDPAGVAMLVRLGKLLEAADQGQQLDRTSVSMPDWLQYLLNDALWASFPDADAAKKGADRPAWDVTLLASLLAYDEFPSAMTLPIVFERRELDAYYHEQTYRRLLAPGALDDYMLANPADVHAAAAVLSAVGRALLVNRIGSNKTLLDAFGQLVVKLAVGDSRTVRAAASRFIDSMDKSSSTAFMGEMLRTGQTDERANAADLMARTQGEAAMLVLEAALDKESSKPVQQSIRNALSRLQAADDADALELPEPPPLPPAPDQVLGDDAIDLLLENRKELLERLRKGAEDEAESNRTSKYAYTFRQKHYERYRALSESQLRAALRALNGQGGANLDIFGNQEVDETLAFGRRLESRADFGLLQLLRWTANTGRHGWGVWFHHRVQAWVRRQDKDSIDLRQLAALTAACGGQADSIPMACLRQTWFATSLPQALLPPDRIWPMFAASPELIDEGIGMAANLQRGRYEGLDLGRTLSVLATFPVIPARWLPRVMELALGDGKTHRAAAQQVLARLPDIGKRVCDTLQSTKQELRIEAARWLEKLDYRAGVPALHAALAKETRETASAAMMTALENLGEDMSAYLAPAKLLAQARKGLKGKPPAGMAWLNLDSVPACAWLDGSPVEAEIIRWWVVLACKLKEPGGNALLERYLGLLAQPGRAALGAWLLHQFIARDTAHPPLEDGIAWAQAHAAQRYQNYQTWARQHPQYYEAQGKLTPEQVFEQLKREKMGEYLGTAINEKGLLALISGMPGHEMVSAIRLYMRDHYPRRAQVEALLEAACVSNEASVIQFTLGVARRYRTASVQEKARMLVQRIAERNGWTQDQLADRTVPTGGLDETGRLSLQYGSRQYTVVLDPAMKPTLRNEEGKPVSALPAPRQDDAAEAIKEAKQQFATCKKELKQVIEMQTSRLYEAMCAGRLWPAAEWREYLQLHPIVGRLAQRLVWQETTGDGAPARLFRPTEDGSLIDASDDEVTLDDSAAVSLSHGSLIATEHADAWIAHFKDYKLTPLFPQLARKRPALSERRDGAAITDRQGWVSDAFTLRGAFNKLGYQRGQTADGGVFLEYKKDFTSAGLSVIMEFSGNALPEENLPAAIKTLSFRSTDGQANGYEPVALEKIPPVLLAEAYGDYHAVAAACAGYDPDWEKKMPW